MAEYGASALNLSLQSLIGGIAGFANAARGELAGLAINKAAGEKIAEGAEYVINKGAKVFQKLYPELTDLEAYDLSSGAVVMTSMLKEDGSAKQQCSCSSLSPKPKYTCLIMKIVCIKDIL